MDFVQTLVGEFKIKTEWMSNILSLIDDGNTIPFIARYRKEMHGTQDDQKLREIAERYEYLQNFDKRREAIRASIDSQGKLTEELNKALDAATTMVEIEDIYLPYKPKKRTRASIAKEKGLEPLALTIFGQETDAFPIDLAEGFVDAEKGVETAQDALAGALDIIAEMISDSASIRKRLRNVAFLNGKLASKAADPDKDSVYANYYDYSEPMNKIAGHRVLALNRGEKEGFLKVKVDFDREKGMKIVLSETVKNSTPCADAVVEAANDAYDRLIFPSIETQLRSELFDTASESAIGVFSTNLRQLLMQPPIKGKVALGLDPGYRTGCKVAVVDATGRVLDTGVIYCAPPYKKIAEAKATISALCRKHGVQIIAIGNGTASKETEMFAAELIGELNMGISYMVVSEAGASVYSASKLAAEEFPEYDVSLRSAVSIARRLQDPLAELVKIEPRAIGVGQYQHDMPRKRMDEALDGVVEDCVNSVGVDLNTASPSLLSRIAGINGTISKNIVAYREENGAFKSRAELKKVSKLGPKAFEQCAGFCRVAESKNVLDNTGVHPESYDAAKDLLTLCGYTLDDVKKGGIGELKERVASLGEENVAGKIGVGVPTLNDIVKELLAPGRDMRDELPPPMLRTDVLSMEDLTPGMELKGTVRNVIDFGAFVDIGVHQDGLVHISQISNTRINHPADKLKVGDVVTVWVMSVDLKKQRISLTMKGKPKENDQ